MSGKGSGRRAGANDVAYRENYERTFGVRNLADTVNLEDLGCAAPGSAMYDEQVRRWQEMTTPKHKEASDA